MAQYETRGQILLLFLGAALVSAAVIFLLRIEAKARYGDGDEDSTASDRSATLINTAEDKSVWAKLSQLSARMRGMVVGSEEGRQKRRKRSTEYESGETSYPYFTWNESNNDLGYATSKIPSQLEESLLTEALSGHKIRNLEEKISELDPDGQVVKGITDYFCQTDINRLQDELEAEKERSAAFNDNMNAADSVISNLVTSIQNLENTVDELKTDLKKAKAESRASAGQRMHHLPPAAMTGDLKMARDDRSNNRPIVQDENVCQPYGGVLVAVMLTTLANFSLLMLLSLVRKGRRSNNSTGFVAFVDDTTHQANTNNAKSVGVY